MDWQCIIYMPVCINICDLSHENMRKRKEGFHVRGHIFHQKDMFQIIKITLVVALEQINYIIIICKKSLQQNVSMIFKLTLALVTTTYTCKMCQHAGWVKMEYI